jgi:hypothetical protein
MGDDPSSLNKKGRTPYGRSSTFIKFWLPFVDVFRTLWLRPTPELEMLFNDLRKPDWIIPYVQQCQHEGERGYVNSLNGF